MKLPGLKDPYKLLKTDGVEIMMGDCDRDEIEVFVVADKLPDKDEYVLRYFAYYEFEHEFERDDDDSEKLVSWDWCVHVKVDAMRKAIKKAIKITDDKAKKAAKEAGDAGPS